MYVPVHLNVTVRIGSFRVTESFSDDNTGAYESIEGDPSTTPLRGEGSILDERRAKVTRHENNGSRKQIVRRWSWWLCVRGTDLRGQVDISLCRFCQFPIIATSQIVKFPTIYIHTTLNDSTAPGVDYIFVKIRKSNFTRSLQSVARLL